MSGMVKLAMIDREIAVASALPALYAQGWGGLKRVKLVWLNGCQEFKTILKNSSETGISDV